MSPNNPEFLVSDLLRGAGFRHGFFTRHGGVSQGPYASLNFSLAVGDDPAAVGENVRRAAFALGVAPERLHYLSQVHGREVVVVRDGDEAADVRRKEGDALVALPGRHACGVRVADCVPVLLADSATRVVAAVHAGWRGVVADVIGATIARMGAAGARPESVVAAIGPHISVAAFEVGEDVADELAHVAGTQSVVSRTVGRKPHVDLRAVVRVQLLRSGLRTDSVDDVQGCTYSDEGRFFSYRRDGKVGGRHLAAISAG
jgi:hypothetical protein